MTRDEVLESLCRGEALKPYAAPAAVFAVGNPEPDVRRPEWQKLVTDLKDLNNQLSESNPSSSCCLEALTLSVTGYADSSGTAEGNQLLSGQRADAVAEILSSELGIDLDHVTTTAGGVAGDDDGSRRVEVTAAATVLHEGACAPMQGDAG